MADSAMPEKPAGIYLIAAHPRWRDSRVNRRLLAAARLQAEATPQVGLDIQDLYASYPDYFVDVKAERARLARAAALVLVHPLTWRSMPALQKLWLDEVLGYGWAYGPASAAGPAGGTPRPAPAGVPGTALRDKALWLVAALGDDDAESDWLAPYRQVAAQCGMRWLPPLVLRGAATAARDRIETHVQAFRQRLAEPL